MNKTEKWIIELTVKRFIRKELKKMTNLLQGKKTYFVGIVMIFYAVSGALLGHLTTDEAIKLALEGLGFITVRSAVANK